MFGRNKTNKNSSKTRDCQNKANSNVEVGYEMGKKSSKSKTKTPKKSNNASYD